METSPDIELNGIAISNPGEVQARAAPSQNQLTLRLIKQLIVWSQTIPICRARGAYSGLTRLVDGQQDPLARSRIEYDDSTNFLGFLKGLEFERLIAGKDVLDYGSGYGGRTVWMAQWARSVSGIEIVPNAIELGSQFARSRDVHNVKFHLGDQRKILFDDATFDVIVTFDVLEHVERPDVMLNEFYRVLKPGGKALIIFTPYYGMFAHHLNYITLLPALHWMFSPQDLVDAVNDLLTTHPTLARLGIAQQPNAGMSFNGKRRVLPTLNGLTRTEYLELIRETGFQAVTIRSTPILEKYTGAGRIGLWANRLLMQLPKGDELFGINLLTVLTHPVECPQLDTRASATRKPL